MAEPVIGRLKYTCKYPRCQNSYYTSIQDVNYKNKIFYRWPKDKETFELWRQICYIGANVKCNNFFLCQDHFDENAFVNESKRRLNFKALPRLPIQDDIENVDPEVLNLLSADPILQLLNEDVGNNNCHSENILQHHELCSNDAIKNTAVPLNDDHNYYRTAFPLNDDHNYSNNSQNKNANKNEKGLLRNIGLTQKELTPKKQKMYTAHKNLCSQVSKLKTKLVKNSEYLKEIKNMFDNGNFDFLQADLNEVTKNFIKSQILNCNKSPMGRRWSVEDKAFALSIYKRSPKLYRYLQSHFILPSVRSLKLVLSKIPFETGINKQLLQNLKARMSGMQEKDLYVALSFDAISLDTVLCYQGNVERIIGYKDLGHLGRFKEIANHALVFMIRGLATNYKQIIAYYFTTNSNDTDEIKKLIVKVISELQEVGFNVVATVCDQEGTNRAALQALYREVKHRPSNYHFIVGGQPIYIIYDVPHLLKNTRNCLINNKIIFEPTKEATMLAIEKAFEFDQSKRLFKRLYNLKKEDFNFKDTFRKMKVGIAAKQLSYNVACTIETAVSLKEVPASYIYTAEFVTMVDQLFDSLNGYTLEPDKGKELRCCLSEQSPHLPFWDSILPKLRRWKVINLAEGNDVTNKFSFIDGWQTTIKSVKAIWEVLKTKKFKYLSLRALNQDNLENLFCQIRQHGISNTNPSCYQFIAALKTIAINSLSAPLGRNQNCESDAECCKWLSNLNEFLVDCSNDVDKNVASKILSYEDFQELNCLLNDVHENQASAYVGGYLLKQVDLPDCSSCKTHFLSADITNKHIFTNFKEFFDDSNRLKYASDLVIDLVQTVHVYLFDFLDKFGHTSELETTFKSKYVDLFSRFKFCPVHEICKTNIINKCIRLTMYKYCKEKKSTLQASKKELKKFKKKIKKFKPTT